MVEELTAEIRVEPAPEGAVPFIPEEDRAVLKFELVPEVPEELPELEPYYPAFVPYKPIEYAAPLKADLIINIEATGANPWDSRLIVITIRDPSDAEGQPFTFFNELEEAVVRAFLEWFEGQDIERLVGYNTSYDHRFIFACALKYRIPAPKFAAVEIYDIMQVLTQVQRKFVPSMNKPGKLEDWTKYLFGEAKLMTFEQVLEAWGQKRYADIITFNEDQVQKHLMLYRLICLVTGELAAGAITVTAGESALSPVSATGRISSFPAVTQLSTSGLPICPVCLAEMHFEAGATSGVCPICKTEVKL